MSFTSARKRLREAIRQRSQFNIIDPSSGLKIGIIVRKGTPFDASRFRRARRLRPAETYSASFASPEDVIIMKTKYYRDVGSEKHLRDITGILKVSRDEVDPDYIADWARRLDLADVWETILQRIVQS